MAANDKQVGGDHYKTDGFEHWDMVVHFKLDYFQGQITKYVMRWRDKGGLQDLEKATHFLEKYKEVAAKEELDRKLAPPPAGPSTTMVAKWSPHMQEKVEEAKKWLGRKYLLHEEKAKVD